MLMFNNLRFAKNNAEMVNSLFSSGGTCAGFYKPITGGFQLLNLQKQLFAFVSPRQGVVVTARRQDNGRALYMYSTCEHTARALNLPNSHMETCKAAESAAVV